MGMVAGQGRFMLPGNYRELFHRAILMGGGKGRGFLPAKIQGNTRGLNGEPTPVRVVTNNQRR